MESYKSGAPKKATNLSLNVELLRAARKRDINLSATLEAALIEKLQALDSQDWLTDNEVAIEEYAAHVKGNGVYSDGVRRF